MKDSSTSTSTGTGNSIVGPSTSNVDIESGTGINQNKINNNNNNIDNNINTPLNLLSTNQNKNKFTKKALVVVRTSLYIILGLIYCYLIYLIWTKFGSMYGIGVLVVSLVAVLVAKVGLRWFYVAIKTTPRDTRALFSYIKLLMLVKKFEKKNVAIADIFQMHVAKHPEKKAIICAEKEFTFRELNEFSNKIANVFLSHGYKRGDVVALLMENRPEFVGTWLGLSKIGIITPLINTNLKGPSLLHSITIAESKALIYSEDLSASINDISKDLPSSLAMYQFNENANKTTTNLAKDLTALLSTVSKDKITSSAEKPDHHDQLLYIYTSGTTGLPKAAVISHSRYVFICAGIHYTMGFKSDDIFYTPLPLYHTAGGVMSMGQAIVFGSTVVIRKKFSASKYFEDCVKYNCTVAQYIGEMCRYCLATPDSENDTKHKIRIIFGNGLRPQIWPQFVQRFGIPKVGEFYGATEGNANIVNTDNTPGAIGFISRIIPTVYPITIIRADPDTGEPIRNEKGLCQVCPPNEPGVFIGKIIAGNPSRAFLGYVDKKASEKKIVKDVFRKGDMAFLSGDVLVADEFGYLFFKDRTGDTFRWKGENVSTSEVEAQVSNVAGYRDSIVYGVEIPSTEGRAGMAAIYDPDNIVDINIFAESLKKVLPIYAVPQFLRFLTKIDLTGTFKLRKVDLQKEGFNPDIVKVDKLFYLEQGKYKLLTPEIYEKICRNEIRF